MGWRVGWWESRGDAYVEDGKNPAMQWREQGRSQARGPGDGLVGLRVYRESIRTGV